jgi:agmatine deiminase
MTSKPQEKPPLSIGLVQMAMSEDPRTNTDRAAGKVEEAAAEGAKIVCLPEMFQNHYFPQEAKKDFSHLAEPVPGPTTERFAVLARGLGIVLILPLFEKAPDGRFFNTAAVIDADGSLLERYRKIHIPHDPLFYEQDYFAPGDLGYRVYRTRYGAFAVLICYDQWFPEAARACILEGAEILFYPTAIGWIRDQAREEDWHNGWETVQRAHAIANGVHVAAVNRVGREVRLDFWGGSFACDAFGQVLQRASSTDEEMLIVAVDLSQNEGIREGWGFLRNRRPETYGGVVRSEGSKDSRVRGSE